MICIAEAAVVWSYVSQPFKIWGAPINKIKVNFSIFEELHKL